MAHRSDNEPPRREAPDPERRGERPRRKRPIVSVGDALRAFHALEPGDDHTRRAILEILGLWIEPTVPAPPNIGPAKPSSPRGTGRTETRRPAPVREPSETDTSVPRLPDAGAGARPLASMVTRVHDTEKSFPAPDWLRDGSGPAMHIVEAGAPPEPLPIFARVQQRGILTAAVATSVPEGDVDLDAVVEILGRGRPLTRVPRLPRETTRRGTQVLLDRSPGLMPFRADQAQIVDALDELLADDRLAVFDFVGCPLRGILAPPPEGAATWTPPPPGTPVLAVTDLGIGGPLLDERRGRISEWLDFAHTATSAGCPLIGLVPYEATRWPPTLARAMTLLHWSERTTAGEVRNALRDARERVR